MVTDQYLQEILSPYVDVKITSIHQSSKLYGLIKRKSEPINKLPIGQGHISEVRLVQFGHRKLAVKMIRKQLLDDRMIRSLVNEVSTLKDIDHPHVIRIKGIVIDQKTLGIVMDWAPNGDMFAYLTKYGPVNEQTAKKWLSQLAWAVDELHSQCIAHRDIKPENILVDANDNLVLTDFEMCHNFRQQGFPLMSESCGSPTYCPPEVVMSSDRFYDGCKADIWALGVTIYTCVAGYLPFDDLKYSTASIPEIRALYEHISCTDLKFPPWFSADLKDLLNRMLDKCYRTRASIVEVKSHPWLSENAGLWSTSESRSRSRYVSWATNTGLRKIIDMCMEPGSQVVSAPIIWDPYVGGP